MLFPIVWAAATEDILQQNVDVSVWENQWDPYDKNFSEIEDKIVRHSLI